ncbi:hypothetical protein DFJ74DRAFT_657034 [Hyaloraphidium curvatum]|nr:hypothetical protein DFJ74DRAFT_657034 [Hyaloraphidium curvatum]
MEGTEAQDASTAKKGRAPRRKAAKTQDDGNTLAAALVNRLPRADLEDLMLEAMRSGAVPLEHVKARLPENRRELVSQKIDVVAKDLRSGAVGAFAALPNEVQLLIFSMLPFVDRLRAAALVCRSWRELLKVPVLWESAEFEWGFLKKPPRHFTLSSISRLFGRAEGCFKTLDLANIRKIHYQATSDLSSPDLKKIFAWTPNVVDLELSGEKSLTDHAIQQASKAYAPNLRRFVVRNSKIYADTVVKILDQNPNIEDLCLMMHYISAAELARFARAGSALRPGGAHGFSRIVRLSLNTDRHSLSVDPAAIAQLGSLFSELEYLHISGFTTHSRSSNSDLAVPLPALEPMPRLRTLLIDHILVGLSSTFQVPNPARPQETVDRLFRNLVSIIHAACSSKLETLGLDVDTNFVLKKEKLQGAKQQPLPLLAGALQLPGGWPKLRQLGLRGMRVAAAPGRFTTEEKELLTAIDAPELRFVVGGKLGAQDDLQEMVKVLVETTGQRWRQGGSGSGMDEWMRLSTYRSTAWSRSD